MALFPRPWPSTSVRSSSNLSLSPLLLPSFLSLSWEPIVVLSRTHFTKMLNRLLAEVYLEPLQAESSGESNIIALIVSKYNWG